MPPSSARGWEWGCEVGLISRSTRFQCANKLSFQYKLTHSALSQSIFFETEFSHPTVDLFEVYDSRVLSTQKEQCAVTAGVFEHLYVSKLKLQNSSRTSSLLFSSPPSLVPWLQAFVPIYCYIDTYPERNFNISAI